VIARSNEAKALRIAMGAPWHLQVGVRSEMGWLMSGILLPIRRVWRRRSGRPEFPWRVERSVDPFIDRTKADAWKPLSRSSWLVM
jgi:hypothetical protein